MSRCDPVRPYPCRLPSSQRNRPYRHLVHHLFSTFIDAGQACTMYQRPGLAPTDVPNLASLDHWRSRGVVSWSVIDSFIPTACQCPLTGLFLLLPSRPLILDFSLATRPSFTTTSPYYRLLAYNTPRAGSLSLGHQCVGDGLTGWFRTTHSTPFPSSTSEPRHSFRFG